MSNLPYLSKIIERVVAARLSAHMSEHNLSEPYQSAYKPNHSVETALLCVQNDILKAVDNKKITILVLLDLSAAFDTVDHKVLLRRLSQDVGVAHHALKWFTSYMSDRTQSVHDMMNHRLSVPFHMVSPKARCPAPAVFYIHSSCFQDQQQVQSDVPPLCR